MRPTRLLLPALLALITAACSSQKPAYYVTDAATGQRVSTGQQSTTRARRGLMSSSSSRANGAYAYASPKSQTNKSGRGLFNSDVFSSGLFSRRARAPVYRYQPQPQPPQTYSYQPPRQQTYSYRPPQQQTYPQQSSTMQYRPPQPARQAYAQQPYQQRQPRPAGYYAERYRWY
jgi:hypothetical protein